ncbi:MAG TPA: energy transducer TonB [Polyangiaceae bacterium]
MTSLAGRAVAVAVSAGAHAALLVTSLGHPAPGSTAAIDAIELDVAPVQQVADDTVDPALARPGAGGIAWPTHTHPYPVPASHDLVPHDPSLVHTFAMPSPPAPVASPPSDVALHSEDVDAPRFTISLGPTGTGSNALDAPGATPSIAAASPPDGAALLSESSVDARARLVRGAKPVYPDAARAGGVEGTVGLELIVDDDGIVENARVVRAVGHGLDEAALAAVRQFRFAPAMKSGHPVHVRMAWSVEFRLTR